MRYYRIVCVSTLLAFACCDAAGSSATAGKATAAKPRSGKATRNAKGKRKAIQTSPANLSTERRESEAGGAQPAANATAEEKVEKRAPAAAGVSASAQVPPLFAFPPAPGRRRGGRAAREDAAEDVLPAQQRVVKYLTDDKIFATQVACSAYCLASIAVFLRRPSASGSYEGALVAVMCKSAVAVVGRLRRVLVPHLLYEPDRYGKFRARVMQLAAEPSIQSLIYCGIFLLALPQLGRCLAPLALREAVYFSCVAAEVAAIAAPGAAATLATLLEWPLAVFLAAGDVKKLRAMDPAAKRALLGRHVAQLSFKLESALIGALLLRVYAPGVVGPGGVKARALFVARFAAVLAVYLRLLWVKNMQLGDDVRVFRGLTLGGVSAEWLDMALDSGIFAAMLGVPWWLGLVMPLLRILDPRGSFQKELKEGGSATAVLRERLFNALVGRDRSKDAENDELEAASNGGRGGSGTDTEAKAEAAREAAEAPEQTAVARSLKVAAVALGLTDD